MEGRKRSTLWTWVKRIGLTLLVLLLIPIVAVAGIIAYDSVFGGRATDVANVEYADGQGNTLYGYLAEPEGAGPHPAVLLFHEWWGLNEGITELADALAEEGYVVFAPDIYRNRVTDQFVRAIWMRVTGSEEEVASDADSALAYLLSLDGVDREHVASMGFCFGGGQSLLLGLRQSDKLAVTIIYYGSLVTDAERLQPLSQAQPVLGIFAEEDVSISPEEVREFEAALNSLNIENEITIYPDVPHAFLSEENYNQPGAAQEAWQQTLAFLEENLKR